MAFKLFNHQKYVDRLERAFQEDKERGLTGKELHNAFQASSLLALAAQLDEDVAAALAKLEKRLEDNPPFTYEGVHENARQYERGQFVTYNGGLWHCNRLTRQRPGDGNDWQLAVKSHKGG